MSSQKSEILHFNRFLLSKSYNVSAKKSTEELSLMLLKSDTKFKEKLTCSFKYDMRNLVNFHLAIQKSKKRIFDGLFFLKVCNVWATKILMSYFHDTEQWCKIWINPELVVLKIAWGIGWIFIKALKGLMGSFCPKHIMF